MKFAIAAFDVRGHPDHVVYPDRSSGLKVLIVAPEDQSRYLTGGFIERNSLVTERIDTGQQGIEAAARDSYSLIMVRVPLPDMSVSALATGLKQRFSLNGSTPVLLLAEGRQYEAAQAFRSAQIQVVNLNDPAADLDQIVTRALGIALRAAVRLDVELEVETGSGELRHHGRTRDLSSSGMLLESRNTLPVGTEFAFNFTLPQRFTPIHGRAQVVRHAPGAEIKATGMGVRFVDFPQGAEDAIQTFVNQQRLRAT